jgi:hypothetical protein
MVSHLPKDKKIMGTLFHVANVFDYLKPFKRQSVKFYGAKVNHLKSSGYDMYLPSAHTVY